MGGCASGVSHAIPRLGNDFVTIKTSKVRLCQPLWCMANDSLSATVEPPGWEEEAAASAVPDPGESGRHGDRAQDQAKEVSDSELKEKTEAGGFASPEGPPAPVPPPGKLAWCRGEGEYWPSARPYVQVRRGLPRRALPAWMVRRNSDPDSSMRPVAGRRAFAKPCVSETEEPQSRIVQRFEEALFIPVKPVVRKYLHQRFILFRATNAVAVRRLGEVSKKKPGLTTVAVIGMVLLMGLLGKAVVEVFDDETDAVASPVASVLPKPAPAARPDRPTEDPKAGKARIEVRKALMPDAPPQPVQGVVAAAPEAGKAGTDGKPVATASLDEQQKALEHELEQAILAMRSDSSAASYARQHEAAIIELQRKIQELIPLRGGREASLALSRSLASVHLLGGRRQAARNVLLDMRDTLGSTHPEGDPEIRLADHLLKLTDVDPKPGPEGQQGPLTPGEMAGLLARFAAGPPSGPATVGAITGES